jgi:hypothetical protein
MIHSLSHLPTLRSSRIAQFALILFLIVSPFIFCTPTAHALSVTLAWDPSAPNEDVAGYKIYFGTESQNYATVIDVRNATMKSVTTLKKGMVYYFAATAYNSYGVESSFSEEVAVNTCTYKISPKKKKFKGDGGEGKVKVNTQPGCPWEAVSGNVDVLIINGTTSEAGKGYIFYSVSPNPSPDERSANLIVEGNTFVVNQKGIGISN